MRKMQMLIALSLLILTLGCQPQKNETDTAGSTADWNFERIVVDSAFARGYQITAADFNNDQKPDLAAVSDRDQEIAWYENPTWKKHIISDTTNKNIDLAPHDINADDHIDLALACRFNLGNSTEGGYVYWLENPGNLNEKWKAHYIDSIPTAHRLRWADVDGNGREELINLPIIGIGAIAPEYDVPLKMVSYEIPANPVADTWTKIIIDSSLYMAHGISIEQFDNDNKPDILTASFEGVMLYTSVEKEGNVVWRKKQLGSGDTSPRPKQGTSEVGLGELGATTEPFIATIEPWHGHQVVVYTPNEHEDDLWTREIIDTTFVDGHALQCADLNNDGISEIIAGHRGGDYNLYLYQYNIQENAWSRFALDDGGMSAAGLFIFDFDEDGYLDIAACGSRTDNIVLYRNLMGK
jgi:hypothetical protein